MKCTKCGNVAEQDAVFCDQCGTRLQPEVTKEVPKAEPAPAAQTAPVAAPTPAPAPVPAVQPPMGVICPSCKASNTPGELFCADCGAKLPVPQPEAAAIAQPPVAPVASPASAGAPTCPACGAALANGDEFCVACGADVKGAKAAAAAQPTATATPAPASALAAPAAQSATECPACGGKVKPGDTFCEFCGAALVTAEGTGVAAAASQTAKAAIVQPAAQALPGGQGPFLVVVGSGIEIALPTDREVVVGREDPYSGVFPDVDLTPHGGEDGGVSRRHFRIRFANNQFTIEDLNSTNFTLLNRKQVKPGTPLPLANGDEISAGRVKLIFKVR